MQQPQFQVGVIRPVECFKEGWELIKDQYWLFFGISIVGMLLAGFSMYILFGTMMCGIYYCLDRKYHNQPFNFGDLFKGFESFLPGFIVSLFFIVPNIVLAIGNFTFQIFLQTQIRRTGDMGIFWTYFGIYMTILFVVGVIMACFHALIIFSFPLITEYKMSGMDAIKLSAKAAWQNLGGVVGLIACQIGLIFLGALACYVGMFFVIPIVFAGLYVAYRKVFPSGDRGGFDVPPPPNEFRGAGQGF